jgi:hypothetical protein
VDEVFTAQECHEVLNELGYVSDDAQHYISSGKVTGPKGLLMSTNGVDLLRVEFLRSWLVDYQFLLADDVDDAIQTVLRNRRQSDS